MSSSLNESKEPLVALIDHGLDINRMLMEFFKKVMWPINTKHGWKERGTTHTTEGFQGSYANVQVKVWDVDID